MVRGFACGCWCWPVLLCAGQFKKGMKVRLARTGKTLALTRPQKLFAQERSTVETGFAGDGETLSSTCLGRRR